MSILSGFKKVRRRIRLPDGYKLLSLWTSSQTVEMDDGTTLESNKAKWDDASDKKHEHTNKSALDSITSEKVSKWDTLAESNVTGVKGNTESSYRTGNVNITSSDVGAVNKSGDTMTGALTVNGKVTTGSVIAMNDGKNTFDIIRVYDDGDSAAYGTELVISGLGNTYIGGGESAIALKSTRGVQTEERLHLSSDNDIYFWVNCNDIGSRLQIILDKSRNFYPATNNTGSVGTSSYKWANMYATTFHGSLSGNAASATKLSSAPAKLTNMQNLTSSISKSSGSYTGNGSFVNIGPQLSDNLNANYVRYTSSPLAGYVIQTTGYYFLHCCLIFSTLTQTYASVKRLYINLNKKNSTAMKDRPIDITNRNDTYEMSTCDNIFYIEQGETLEILAQMDGGASGTFNFTFSITPLFTAG